MGSPYAGDKTKFPPKILIPDDSDPPNASTFDPPFEGLADRTANLASRFFVEPAVNWQPPMASLGMSGAILWDDLLSQWLVLTGAAGNKTLRTYDGLGGVPDVISTVLVKATPIVGNLAGSIATDTSNVYISAVSDGPVAGSGGGGLWYVQRTDLGHAWINVSGPLTATTTDYKIVTFGGTVIWAEGDTLGSIGIVLPNGGGAAGGTGINVLPMTYPVARWLLAKSGAGATTPHVLAIPCVTAATSGGAVVYATANATSFTTTVVGGGWTGVPVGLAWGRDAAGPCWLLAVETGPGYVVQFWRSTDGAVWAIIPDSPYSFSTNGFVLSANDYFCDLAAIDGLWLGLVYNVVTGVSRVLFSPDASTWYGSQASLVGRTGLSPFSGGDPSPPQIAASWNQAAFVVNANVATGVRFSAISGPPSHTF